MTKRNLVLIHRGTNYESDFDVIATKVFALDEDITIYTITEASDDQLPTKAWLHPTLVVALMPRFNLKINRGTILRNRPIPKLRQATCERLLIFLLFLHHKNDLLFRNEI